jgi:hypothetical protein
VTKWRDNGGETEEERPAGKQRVRNKGETSGETERQRHGKRYRKRGRGRGEGSGTHSLRIGDTGGPVLIALHWNHVLVVLLCMLSSACRI